MNSQSIRSLLLNRFNVTVENAPPLHSTSNGQVERFHSTLVEIARCLKLERGLDDTVNLILQAAIEYNKTVHSVTNKRPIDIIHAMPPELAEEITNRIDKAQEIQLKRMNESRSDRTFQVGQTVLVKQNKRLGNKITPRYKEEKIDADIGTNVLINGRVVHKDNLR